MTSYRVTDPNGGVVINARERGDDVFISGNGTAGNDDLVFISLGTVTVADNSHADVIGSDNEITIGNGDALGIEGGDNDVVTMGEGSWLWLNSGANHTVNAAGHDVFSIRGTGQQENGEALGNADVINASNSSFFIDASTAVDIHGSFNTGTVSGGDAIRLLDGANNVLNVVGSGSTIKLLDHGGDVVTAVQGTDVSVIMNGISGPGDIFLMSGGNITAYDNAHIDVIGGHNTIRAMSIQAGSAAEIGVQGGDFNSVTMDSGGFLWLNSGYGTSVATSSSHILIASDATNAYITGDRDIIQAADGVTIGMTGHHDSIAGSFDTIYLRADTTDITITGDNNIIHVQQGDTYTIHGLNDTVVVDSTPLDIVTGNLVYSIPGEPGSVLVTLHDQHGGFQNPVGVHTGTSYAYGQYEMTAALEIADFNGDGKSDIATVGFAGVGGVDSSSIGVLLGNGDGTFQTPTVYHTGANLDSEEHTQALAIADFNGDGALDIATASTVAVGNNGLSMLLGNGDGSFQTATTFHSGISELNSYEDPVSLVAGDLNGDGKSDLIAGGIAGYGGNAHSVSILLSNGDGTFASAATYATGNLSEGNTDGPKEVTNSVAVGDLNGDGILDVIAGGSDDDYGAPYGTADASVKSLAVFLGNGDGTLRNAFQFSNGTQETLHGTPIPGQISEDTVDVKLADINGDGKLDIVGAAIVSERSAQTDSIFTMLGNGDGTFQDVFHWSNGFRNGANAYESTKSIAVGDINGDGLLDIAAVNETGAIGVLYGHGDGSFDHAVLVQAATPLGYGITLGHLLDA